MDNSGRKEKNRKFYDEAFAEIFTNRQIVESLLQDFVHEEWVKYIDFSTMKVERSVFKGIKEHKRESDLLLTFNIGSNKGNPEDISKELQIFILMELQSTPKPIIMRLLEYLHRIYYRQHEMNGTLFPVIPIVIYNGRKMWTENNQLKNHFVYFSEAIKKYLPLFEYILIDVVRFDYILLKQLKSAAATFFLLDKTNLKNQKEIEKKLFLFSKH